jgi:hypothetical protein
VHHALRQGSQEVDRVVDPVPLTLGAVQLVEQLHQTLRGVLAQAAQGQQTRAMRSSDETSCGGLHNKNSHVCDTHTRARERRKGPA